MKTDTAFLGKSSFAAHFNFSAKSDPFLVFPSSKHNASSSGTGINHLKKLSAKNGAARYGGLPH